MLNENEYRVINNEEEAKEYAKSTTRVWNTGNSFLEASKNYPYVLYVNLDGRYMRASHLTSAVPKPFTIEAAIAYVEGQGRVHQQVDFNMEKFEKL